MRPRTCCLHEALIRAYVAQLQFSHSAPFLLFTVNWQVVSSLTMAANSLDVGRAAPGWNHASPPPRAPLTAALPLQRHQHLRALQARRSAGLQAVAPLVELDQRNADFCGDGE